MVVNYSVRIFLGTWGFPTSLVKNDADASYDSAYAHLADDFLTIQQTFIPAKGLLACVYGPDAVPNDNMVHLLRIWDVVDSGYESDLMLETRQILEDYVNGLNFYTSHHEDSIISPDLFPMNGMDIVAASVHKSPLFFGLDETQVELVSKPVTVNFQLDHQSN